MKIIISTFFTTLLLLISSGCWLNQEVKPHLHGTINEANLHLVSTIDITKYPTEKLFYNRISDIACQDSLPAFKWSENGNTHKIGIIYRCQNAISCYKQRNALRIKDEKIVRKRLVTLDSLESYLDAHISNYGHSDYFSEQPHKAFVSISYQELSVNRLTGLLRKMVTAHEKAKIETPLYVVLESKFGRYYRDSTNYSKCNSSKLNDSRSDAS